MYKKNVPKSRSAWSRLSTDFKYINLENKYFFVLQIVNVKSEHKNGYFVSIVIIHFDFAIA